MARGFAQAAFTFEHFAVLLSKREFDARQWRNELV
jgi:hypothetical protein